MSPDIEIVFTDEEAMEDMYGPFDEINFTDEEAIEDMNEYMNGDPNRSMGDPDGPTGDPNGSSKGWNSDECDDCSCCEYYEICKECYGDKDGGGGGGGDNDDSGDNSGDDDEPSPPGDYPIPDGETAPV